MIISILGNLANRVKFLDLETDFTNFFMAAENIPSTRNVVTSNASSGEAWPPPGNLIFV
jgi:hypothetical protein